MKTHLIWLCISVAALAIGTRFAKEVIRTVEKPVEVIREVPKEVEKVVEKPVEVQAEIPMHYLAARKFADSYIKAEWIKPEEYLAGIPSVHVTVSLDDPQRSKISERELKDLIELSLRKNGVPVKADSPYLLEFYVSGLWDDRNIMYSYSASLSLSQEVRIIRSSEFKIAPLVVWRNAYNGYAGSLKVGEGIAGAAERLVVSFSNAYLAANPK